MEGPQGMTPIEIWHSPRGTIHMVFSNQDDQVGRGTSHQAHQLAEHYGLAYHGQFGDGWETWWGSEDET